MFRAFCSNCGSPAYAFRVERPELLGIRPRTRHLGVLKWPHIFYDLLSDLLIY